MANSERHRDHHPTIAIHNTTGVTYAPRLRIASAHGFGTRRVSKGRNWNGPTRGLMK